PHPRRRGEQPPFHDGVPLLQRSVARVRPHNNVPVADQFDATALPGSFCPAPPRDGARAASTSGMWKRLGPAILITAMAATAADAFTLAESSATMGAHSAAAGSGGSSWVAAVGQTRNALGHNSNVGPANGKGSWATGASKSR